MIWLRSLLFNMAFFGISASIAVLATPLLLAPSRWTMPVIRFWAWTVVQELRFLCGIRLVVQGREYLPQTGPALIAAKHQSAFDTIIWLLLLPRCAYVLKRELLRIPFYGFLVAKAGMIPVDRSAGGVAMRQLLKAGRAAAEAGRQLVIFPEGTRTAPREKVPYQPGIAALAGATGLPVIPVATDSGVHWGRRAFRKRPGTITVSILPPLPAGLPRAVLMQQLETVIERESERLIGGRLVDNSVDECPQPAAP
ncbi:1-acyl-sn-glycerol-3-phosphate acyltransferase [Belnapia sp. T6]|uniref:1-acyl-sn-glycerol-3-phosphate acyltransferase n=1 Tax=Belnapia mucosa TaxID=2804532 RepID=A0ABS1V216_9PROT|nr:lysophospholipid acyltransferase family protein [Belnapia mucosa]MBL6455741.1 1-acyl-sn-glycerol-3-phosphate acyltransferase [Belnapia mucosa]